MGRMVRCDVSSIVILAGPSDQPISVDQKELTGRLGTKNHYSRTSFVAPPKFYRNLTTKGKWTRTQICGNKREVTAKKRMVLKIMRTYYVTFSAENTTSESWTQLNTSSVTQTGRRQGACSVYPAHVISAPAETRAASRSVDRPIGARFTSQTRTGPVIILIVCTGE